MIQEIYAIRDEVGGFYEQPFLAHNRTYAERMLCDYARCQPNSQVVLHSSDYSLYLLGAFNVVTGVIQSLTIPEFVNRVSAYVVSGQQGAAVGDSVPLKPQSDPVPVSSVEPVNASEECDHEDNPLSKAQKEV